MKLAMKTPELFQFFLYEEARPFAPPMRAKLNLSFCG
jgi:hypothetical protein